MPKARDSASGSVQFRHQNTLEDDILATGPLRERTKKRKSQSADNGDGDGDGYIDSKSSRKILRIGRELVQEEQQAPSIAADNTSTAFTFESRFGGSSDPEDDGKFGDDEGWGDEEEETVEEAEVDPNDLDLFNKFVHPGEEPTLDLHAVNPREYQNGTNLADIILEQIVAHEAAQSGNPEVTGGGPPEDAVEIPEKVVEVYSKVGVLLSHYRSGKLPKPFKILPTLPQWEDLLSLTRPDSWTPNACKEAVRIFISSTPQVARVFLETVILPTVREDIHETKKLNTHLYQALQKALYKPAAFMKGVLFPLVESGTCTLREATIVASVITRCSIPSLHSSAALMRLTDIAAEQSSASTESGGATNIFIKAFLGLSITLSFLGLTANVPQAKQYALPYKVVDNLVFHFLRFRGVKSSDGDSMMDNSDSALHNNKLPVLWHQSLLAFATRYRNDITEDQREALLDLLLSRGHKEIGPEVRRELLAGRPRGAFVEENKSIIGGDDTMLVDPV